MGCYSLPRVAVFAVALLLLASPGAEAFFDIFRPRSENNYFKNAFGVQEQVAPTEMEPEEKGAKGMKMMGLTRVPPKDAPSRAARYKVVLKVVDKKRSGNWSIVSENSGVSAMHLVVMRHGKAVMFDTSTTGRSLMRMAQNSCRIDPRAKRNGTMDCWAHAVELDYGSGAIRPLRILTDTWCSSGAFDPDGTLVQTGGYFEGEKAVRYLAACNSCDWQEHPRSFAEGRWYATQLALPDGRFIVVGGRRSFSYEFVPRPGQANFQAVPLPFLRETTDDHENNLYPFVNLLPDGTIFIFANDRAVILDYKTELVIRKLPVLPGGGRNYPASAMSALLPLNLRGDKPGAAAAHPEPEIIVCGGAPKTAFKRGENNTYQPALRDCGRIKPTSPDPTWEVEDMPVGRVMGDMLILPTGDLLMLNGAAKGCSGWGFARKPVVSPLLYSPHKPQGSRFMHLVPSSIPRMYHSTAAVLPDASVLVAGGNTNAAYNFSGVDFPTEVCVERFTPPYLQEIIAFNRPTIDMKSVPPDGMRYGAKFTFRFSTPVEAVVEADVKVTMYAPPFTTHGYSMNQRLLILAFAGFVPQGLSYEVTVEAPPKPELAPPGYYLVFVAAKDVPSEAAWVKIQ